MRYRSKLEIIADILDAANDGAKKTRIMYIANLSYKLLGKYLKKVVSSGLIICNNNYYEITEKGQIFLEKFKNFSGKYTRINRELEEILFERDVLERMCELGASESDNLRRGARQRPFR